VIGHNLIAPLIFAATAAVSLFNWAIMPRFNVGARQRRLRFCLNVDRGLSLLAFFVFAALALVSFFVGNGPTT
jgi:hypothetical protein